MTEQSESSQEARGRRPMFDYQYERDDDSHVFRIRPPRFSGEFFDHLGNAQKEVLLAIRSLIDDAIEKGDRDNRSSSGPRNIQVS